MPKTSFIRFALCAVSASVLAGSVAQACPAGWCGGTLFHIKPPSSDGELLQTIEDGSGDGGNSVPAAFQINSRWSSTATNGFVGTSPGVPITLTWSIVSDGLNIPSASGIGEPAAGSSLRARLDTLFGAGPGGSDLTQRPWFTFFTSAFSRWSQLAGLTYTYEPNDSGIFGSSGGIVGIRGDVRIGGKPIDGVNGTLAYNFFAPNGDMVIDTTEGSNLSSSTNNFRSFRNILMHEHGHGLGIAHVDTNDSLQLMQPFLNTDFDGPQIDDILAAQRNYGDAREKNGRNNTAATASNLGVVGTPGSTVSVGTSAPNVNTLIPNTAVDFVSIVNGGNTSLFDIDFYSFTIAESFILNITLEPRGYVYLQGPQNGAQAAFDSRAQSDLVLAIFGPDGTTQLAISDVNGVGGSESILDFGLPGGTYFARITGKTLNSTQLYRLDIQYAASRVIPEPGTAGLLLGVAPLALARRRRLAPG